MALNESSGIEDSELRDKYREESTDRIVRNTKIAALTAAAFFPVFGVLDYILYRIHLEQFLILRATVVVLSLVVYVIARTTFGRKFIRIIAMFVYLLSCWAIIVMIHLDGGFSSPYYAGINLVLIGMVFVLPLSVGRTIVICLVVYLSYMLPFLWGASASDPGLFANNDFFLIATMILVVLSSYLGSRMRRTEFIARQQLAGANEELKQLDTQKSQFFANVSHEVRTPLTSIISPIQSMYQGDLGEFTSEQREVITQVYRNALRLLDMINQMLEFAKFDAGRMQLRLSRVHLPTAVHEITTLFSEVAARKGLRLEEELDVETPAVYLDRDKIDRILTNLIRNAIKFTEKGRITVRVRPAGERIVMQVEDTGIGISPDFIARIFERFQQVDSSTTRRFEGTGLGLALAKEAAELQHGEMRVESKLQRGSIFSVSFPGNLEELVGDAFLERRETDRRTSEEPYRGPERRQLPRRTSDAASLRAEQILLTDAVRSETASDGSIEEGELSQRNGHDLPSVVYVEDNDDLRRYVSRMLRRAGYEVLTAGNGREGLGLIRRSLPSAVVSDVMMPFMDGYDLLKEVKSDPATRHIPFILVTAKSEQESRLEGLEHGADDYIAKPINLRELDARLRNALTLQKYQHTLAESEQLAQRVKELAVGFSQSLELRDTYTGRHSWDVLELGTICAEQLGVAVDATLRDALLLHDIGKLGIPDNVLLKPGPLDTTEWEVMKSHAELGSRLLRGFGSLADVSAIILAHQEHFDGSGYPRGLSGNEIPLAARIIAVADAWHAMTGDRPYRKAMDVNDALNELVRHKGIQFDPAVVDALVRGLVARGTISPEAAAAAGVGAGGRPRDADDPGLL